MSLSIIGTGSCVPELKVDNFKLSEYVETNDEWITQRTGIRSRHILQKETLSYLAAESAKNAIQDAGISPDEIDFVICSTLQGDYLTPSLACIVQKEIGAACPSFDINAACSGFMYALDLADAYLSANKANNILIVCAEAMSRIVNWEDRSTCVLFGDGAGAVVVTKGNDLLALHTTAAGSTDSLRAPVFSGNSPFKEYDEETQYLYMNGQEVYKFAVASVGTDVDRVMNDAQLEPEQIDYYLLHQANSRIIEAARKKLKQPESKFPTNISEFGNTSSASIPILIDELNKKGTFKKGDKLLMSAFGAGMTTGACIIRWSK